MNRMEKNTKTLKLVIITILIALILVVITISIQEIKQLRNLNLKAEIEDNTDIEISYNLSSYNNNIFKINMIITSKNSMISEIKLPENDILKSGNRNEISIDYEFKEDVDYTFLIRTMEGTEKIEVANFKMPVQPVIIGDEPEYFILTLTGVEKQKISIEFDKREIL
ncbi:MAG: hypothetical protein HFJ59_06370 [Clostridia bacterium]|nr:hypothetical protein [Clostridia bacterium]